MFRVIVQWSTIQPKCQLRKLRCRPPGPKETLHLSSALLSRRAFLSAWEPAPFPARVSTEHCSLSPPGLLPPSLAEVPHVSVLISAHVSTRQGCALGLQNPSSVHSFLPVLCRVNSACCTLSITALTQPAHQAPQGFPLPRLPGDPQGSKLGQSQGWPWLFPTSQGSSSFVAWCAVFYK